MVKKTDHRKTKAKLLSEIKQLRQELEQCKALNDEGTISSKDFFELCRIGSWRLDYPSNTFHCSPELADIIDADKNLNHPTFETLLAAIYPDDRQNFLKNIKTLTAEETSFNQLLMFHVSNETYKPILTRVDFVKIGQKKHSLMAFILDVTKLEKITQSLEQERNRYRHLFELSPTGILIEDEHGTIIDANPAFCKSLGYSKKELIDKSVNMFAHPEVKYMVPKNIDNLMAGKTLKHNQKSIRKDGSVVYMELREIKVQLPSGKPGILCLAEDFTQHKKSQEEHLQKEKLQGVLEMAGAVCHELNQPLTTIFITTDLLLNFPEKSKYQEMIEILKKEAIRISNISDKLMHITHYKTRKYLNGIKIVDLDKSTDHSGE
jgi:PAS domain S-box-containing protein